LQHVESDLRTVGESLKELIGSDHPVLHATARHFFDVAGPSRYRSVNPSVDFVICFSRF
jgi:hypothetical protein